MSGNHNQSIHNWIDKVDKSILETVEQSAL